MEMTIHTRILLLVFGIALVMRAVANKTNFCTMGAVPDRVNMGDRGRLRAWLNAMTVALIGVLVPKASVSLRWPPPHRRRDARPERAPGAGPRALRTTDGSTRTLPAPGVREA
jgi:hypothetical protein